MISRRAWAPPPYNDDRKWAVYGSSKAEAEKALWKFVKERKPHFVCNAVLPNCRFGKILVQGQPASTGDMVLAIYRGEVNDSIKAFPPRKSYRTSHSLLVLIFIEYFVDVQDTGRIHVAVMTNSDVQNERILAFAEPFTWKYVSKVSSPYLTKY